MVVLWVLAALLQGPARGFVFEIKWCCGHGLADERQALWGAPEAGPRMVPVLRVLGCGSGTLASHFLSFSLCALTCEMGPLDVPAPRLCLGGGTDWPAVLG